MYSPAGEPEPEWLVRQLAASPKLPIRFHLDCGLMEDRPSGDAAPSILATNRHRRDVLLAKGCRVHYLEFNPLRGIPRTLVRGGIANPRFGDRRSNACNGQIPRT